MSSGSGWSWSANPVLACVDSNVLPLPRPALNRTAPSTPLPSISSPQETSPKPPQTPAPTGPTNENVPPIATSATSEPGAATTTTTYKPRPPPPGYNPEYWAEEEEWFEKQFRANAKAAATRKRKADAIEASLFPKDLPEISPSDPRLRITKSDTCTAVRRKIRTWTDSGAMKVGDFQKELGVSSSAYCSFMNLTDTWDGQDCDTYIKACQFFKARKIHGLPLKLDQAKKPRTKVDADKVADLLDVSGVTLDGEEDDSVPVYDHCDEIRKKIRAFLVKNGVTQADFLREISKTFSDGRQLSAANLRYFMGLKGLRFGNCTNVFYASYVFFEKQRIKDKKPKTRFRRNMEEAWGWEGFDSKTPANTDYMTSGDATVYINGWVQVQMCGSLNGFLSY